MKRNSIHESGEDKSSGFHFGDKGNHELVSETSSLGTLQKFLFLIALLIVGGVLILRSVAPGFFKENKETLEKLTYAADSSVAVVQTLLNTDWSNAAKKLETLEGAGLHREFSDKSSGVTKKDFFYIKNVFIPKNYVKQFDYLSPVKQKNIKNPISLQIPVVGVKWNNANEFCNSKGKNWRLPTYSELLRAENLYNKKQAKKAQKVIRHNLDLNYDATKGIWTSTPESTSFFSLSGRDNFKVYRFNARDKEKFVDDGESSPGISFICVKEPNKNGKGTGSKEPGKSGENKKPGQSKGK